MACAVDMVDMSDAPVPGNCANCLAEIARLYRVDGDLAEALPRMTPGDSEDVLILARVLARGQVASVQTPPTCAACGAKYGSP